MSEKIRERIKALLETKGLSVKKAEEAAGIAKNKLSNFLYRSIKTFDTETAILLSTALGVDWVWLITGEERVTNASIEDVDNDAQEVINLYLKSREGDKEAGMLLEQRLFGLLAALRFKKD